jgi:hypothetical protein
MVAIYLGRQLGGHKHEEIGRACEKKELNRRVRRIEKALNNSKKRT